jgi:hypothetical protein
MNTAVSITDTGDALLSMLSDWVFSLCLSYTVAVATTAALRSKLCHLKDKFVTEISVLEEKGWIEIKL